MVIKVTLTSVALSEPGMDKQGLIENIDAEMQKLGTESEAKPQRKDQRAPQGAQGDLQSIEWLINLAKDPQMAPVYAQGLCFAINRIISALKPSKGETKKAGDKKDGETLATITALGKTLALPAASAVIEAFLKSLGGQG